MVVVTDDDRGQEPASEDEDPAAPFAPAAFDPAAFDPAELAGELVKRMKPAFTAAVAAQAAMDKIAQNMGYYRHWQQQVAAMYEPVRSVQQHLERLGSVAYLAQAEFASRLAETVTKRIAALPNPADLVKLHLQFYPPNWRSLTNVNVDTAVSIVCDEGIPLAWVPRSDIVAKLVDASDMAARDTILVADAADIALDCREALDEVTAPDLKPLADLARDAILALERDTPAAAQALAGNVFDTFLRDAGRRGNIFGAPLGYFKYDKVTKKITPVSDDTLLSDYRIACVLSPVLPALADYNPETDPVPDRFGRHATAHRAHPAQYTLVNAVVAVMLMTSVLREAQESGW